MPETIVRFDDRRPIPAAVFIGNENDNLVESVEFELADWLSEAAVYIYLTANGKSDVVNLGADRVFDITRTHTHEAGRWEAYLEAYLNGDRVWHSDEFAMYVGALPTIGKQIEQAYPTAIEEALRAVDMVTGLEAEAETLPAGSDATVRTEEDETGNRKLVFGIPRGKDGAPGEKGADGKTPVKGTDYWTAQDRAEMKSELAAALVVQEAGQSESLVMSQKAVTDLVADALGSGSAEYETVDSVEEMVDTSKRYVLSTTGTVWAYGETGEPKPLFTNYADPSSSEWMQNTRLNSTNTTAATGMTTTNYIDTNDGDVVRVTGINLDANLGGSNVGAVSKYLQDKKDTANGRSPTRSYSDFVGETDGVYTFRGFSGWLRFCGVPTNGDDNVIITINEEIAYGPGQGWYDTGIAPENSTDGDNYVELAVRINENKAQIREVDARVTALETGAEILTEAIEAATSANNVDDVVLVENAYDASTAKFNVRLAGNAGTEANYSGSLALDYIKVKYDPRVYVLISGIKQLILNWDYYFAVNYYDANKNPVGTIIMAPTNFGTYDGQLPCSFPIFRPNVNNESDITGIENTEYVRIKLGIAPSTTSISAADCEGLIVKFARTRDMTLDATAIPSHWEDAVAAKTETVKALQEAGGKNCVTFAWASDTHIPDNATGRTDHIGRIMARMLDNCEAPFAVVSGDAATRGSMPTEEEYLAEQAYVPLHLAPLWGTDRLLVALGNHDGCWGAYKNSSSDYYAQQFPPEWLWQTFFRGQALDFRRVFSDDGLYFYVDNVTQKTRFIVLNSHFGGEYAVDANGHAVNNRFRTSCYGQVQLDWLADVALDMPSGYGAVIITHVPPKAVNGATVPYTVDYMQVVGIVNAYISRTTFSNSFTGGVDGWSNSTINVDFAAAQGEIIAMFAGHVHEDTIDTETLKCPLLTITAAGAATNNALQNYNRPFGTSEETSFDVVTINRAAKMIYCTRMGAGSDRSVSYAEKALVNLAEPNDTNTTDWSIWCNNARMGSNSSYRYSTNSMVTNLIHVSDNDGETVTLYFDGTGLTSAGNGVTSGNGVALFKGDKTTVLGGKQSISEFVTTYSGSATYYGDGTLRSMTLKIAADESGPYDIRFCLANTIDKSKLYIGKEPID